MKIRATRSLEVTLGALLLGAMMSAGAEVPGAPPPFRYETRCAIIGLNAVQGFVTNQSLDSYEVTGPVRFVFSANDSMSRPAITVAASSLVPPGQTVLAASAKLAFQPQPGETCRFEVEGALRKL